MSILQTAKPIVLDLIATIIFLSVFWITQDIFTATVAGIASGTAQIAILKSQKLAIAPLAWLSFGLVFFCGTVTLLTSNPHFIMLKPSLLMFAAAVVMFRRNWMSPYLPPVVKENVSEAAIMRASRAWPLMMLVLGTTNLIVAFGSSTRTWVWYVSVVPISANISLFVIQYVMFRRWVHEKLRARLATQPI